jgi:hypothetical protein
VWQAFGSVFQAKADKAALSRVATCLPAQLQVTPVYVDTRTGQVLHMAGQAMMTYPQVPAQILNTSCCCCLLPAAPSS